MRRCKAAAQGPRLIRRSLPPFASLHLCRRSYAAEVPSSSGVMDTTTKPAPNFSGGLPEGGSSGDKSIAANLYLLCFIPSPLFHAHWSIFLPHEADPRRGTVIHVRGDPLLGFVHEFERGYVPSENPDKPPFMTKFATIKRTLVRPDGPLQPGKDTTAHNELERVALSIDAPGPSLGRKASKDVRMPLCTAFLGASLQIFGCKLIHLRRVVQESRFATVSGGWASSWPMQSRRNWWVPRLRQCSTVHHDTESMPRARPLHIPTYSSRTWEEVLDPAGQSATHRSEQGEIHHKWR